MGDLQIKQKNRDISIKWQPEQSFEYSNCMQHKIEYMTPAVQQHTHMHQANFIAWQSH